VTSATAGAAGRELTGERPRPMILTMDKQQRAIIAAGCVAIALGVLVIFGSFLPHGSRVVSWPLIIVGVGAAFLLFGTGTTATGLVIPGAIVLGLGCLLYVQNLTGWWDSWSFAWALIPGFTGLGLLLFDRLTHASEGLKTATWVLLAVSASLFLIFAGAVGRHAWAWIVLGVTLVAAGGLVVWRAVGPRKAPPG
jgi:hypothetical protein